MNIPHKIILLEDKQLACVADREHGRIQCFKFPHGEFEFEIKREDFNGRLFSISKQNDVLSAVCGPSLYDSTKLIRGFIFNVTSQELLGTFAPKSGVINRIYYSL